MLLHQFLSVISCKDRDRSREGISVDMSEVYCLVLSSKRQPERRTNTISLNIISCSHFFNRPTGTKRDICMVHKYLLFAIPSFERPQIMHGCVLE